MNMNNREMIAIQSCSRINSLPFNVEKASEAVSDLKTNYKKQPFKKRPKEEIVVTVDTTVKQIDPRKLTKKKIHKFHISRTIHISMENCRRY